MNNNPCRVPQTESALLPDGYLAVFHTEQKRSYIIPPLGALVWELCDGSNSIAQIVSEVQALVGVHGDAPMDIESEVETLVNRLLSNGILVSGAKT